MDLTDEDYDIKEIFYDMEDDAEGAGDVIHINIAIRNPSVELKKMLDNAQRCSIIDCPYIINADAEKCNLKSCKNMICKDCIKYSCEHYCSTCGQLFCEEDNIHCNDCEQKSCSKCLHKYGEFNEETETIICKACKKSKNGDDSNSSE